MMNSKRHLEVANPYASYSTPAPAGHFSEVIQRLIACGVSPGIVWLQLCAVISLLTQGVADVLWPNGRRAPSGVSGLLVGLSGTGKSAIYRLLLEPIEECIADLIADHSTLATGPMIEEATPPALVAFLKDARYGGLFSDEAGALIHLQGAAPLLAKLTDGAPLRQSRKSTGHLQLVGHRFTVLQLLQPWAFEKSRLFSTTRGEVGFINRCLTAVADSHAGSLHGLALPESLASRYRARARELLVASLQNAQARLDQLPALQLSPGARQFFEAADEDLRRAVAFPNSPLTRHVEYVTRHAERILRLAAAIHLYNHGLDGLDRHITLETMMTANQVGHWSINDYLHLANQPTQAQKDALTIEQALRNSAMDRVKLSDLRRYAANLGLTRQRIDKALPELAITGRAQIVTIGKVDHLSLISVRPHYSLLR